MTQTRYEPYNLIDQFHNEINRLFNTSPGSTAENHGRLTGIITQPVY